MSLSIEQVRDCKFHLARRNGYEPVDVDNFVDQVEETLVSLNQQIEQLNHRLPDYARIHHWLPVALDQHPGLLTANGRPRRNEIYHHFSRQIDQCLTQGLTGESS